MAHLPDSGADHALITGLPESLKRDNVKELVAAITRFIEGWNDRCHPFTWTKTADEILPHATRQRTSDARH
jgi:hypothetical protein